MGEITPGGLQSRQARLNCHAMSEFENKVKLEILRILRDQEVEISSHDATRHLAASGFDLSPRTVRLYLQHLEDAGLVAQARRGRTGGRSITPQGIVEIEDARVVDRIGFIVAKIDQMAYQMTYHPRSNPKGTVILNLTVVDTAQAIHALR